MCSSVGHRWFGWWQVQLFGLPAWRRVFCVVEGGLNLASGLLSEAKCGERRLSFASQLRVGGLGQLQVPLIGLPAWCRGLRAVVRAPNMCIQIVVWGEVR